MKAAAIRIWLNGLPLAPLSKGHIRSLMHKLFDLSQLWEYAELGRNPIELVKVKGVTKREKQIVILTPEQAVAIIGLLKEPYSLMVMTVAALGLRLSEMLGLQWKDIDFERKIVTIRRSAYRGSVDEAKTKASHAEVPLPDDLAALFLAWRDAEDDEESELEQSEWVFPKSSYWTPISRP